MDILCNIHLTLVTKLIANLYAENILQFKNIVK